MKNNDSCVYFHTNNGAFMGRLVRLDTSINQITCKHNYPLQISAAVAEFSALAVLLSSSIKYDGLFTLQTQSDGQISMVVVDVTSDGKIRACARFDEAKIKKAKQIRKTEDILESTVHYLGAGHMAFTVDQGENTELYQGIIELHGKTISEFAMKYFYQSEQIETFVKLFLQAPKSETEGWKAAGIMLQKLPSAGGKIVEGSDTLEQWNEAAILADSLKDEEVFDNNLSSEEILHRLFHSNDLVVSQTKNYKFQCRCSKEKLLDTLRTFSNEDIESMSEKGKVSAHCNFCSEQYVFEKGELIKQ